MLVKELLSFDTVVPSELVTTVLMDDKQHVVQCLSIGPLMTGDRLLISGYQEFTNSTTKVTWDGFQIILSTTPDLTGRFLEVTPPSGTNITDTNSIHHLTQGRSRGCTITSYRPTAYALLVTASASSQLPSNTLLNVDPGTGYISIDIFRST